MIPNGRRLPLVGPRLLPHGQEVRHRGADACRGPTADLGLPRCDLGPDRLLRPAEHPADARASSYENNRLLITTRWIWFVPS